MSVNQPLIMVFVDLQVPEVKKDDDSSKTKPPFSENKTPPKLKDDWYIIRSNSLSSEALQLNDPEHLLH